MVFEENELYELLEGKYRQYNQAQFIDTDPIQIPHLFSKKQDIEIAGFFAATLAWGQRPTILKNASQLMDLMDHSPHDFILSFQEKDLILFNQFKHRTFNGEDCKYFLIALQNIYKKFDSMEEAFISDTKAQLIPEMISRFKTLFFSSSHLHRTEKHLADPLKGSAAKRINMLLRWMVRNDQFGVDFGIWKTISPSKLYCPLDVHSGNIARKLGLLKRKQSDWKAVEELTSQLRRFDPQDPVKYDFALFGMGIFEKF